MFVFSLGMSVYSSADYNIPSDEQLNLSDQLDELLSSMCEEEASYRASLEHVLRVSISV